MELLGIVPAIVPAPPPEPFAVQVIIVDWLYREVDGLAEIKMSVLQHIVGHRNRDCPHPQPSQNATGAMWLTAQRPPIRPRALLPGAFGCSETNLWIAGG